MHTSPVEHHSIVFLPPLASPTSTNPNALDCTAILACYKEHQVAKRLTIKDANKTRYNKYGSALLNMFIRKPRDALKSILEISSARNTHHKVTTPSNLSSIRDSETGQITSSPTSVNAIIERLETKLLSPDNKINPLSSLPLSRRIFPRATYKTNTII